MSTHDDDTCPHFVRASLLEAENAKLKAEVERLKEGNDCLGQMHDKEMERSAYLLDEFNRSTAWGRGLESDLSHARVEISFLKAEVERLELKATNIYNAMKIKMEADEVVRESRSIILQKKSNDEVFNFVIKKLEAELAELRASSFVTAVPVEQYERVVMAGDAMVNRIRWFEKPFKSETKCPEIEDWNAAKEGKPSV